MRNERETLEKVIDAAKQDNSVRAVIRTDLVPVRKYIYVCLKAGRPVDMGILDSKMEKLLEEDLFRLYKMTYPGADYSQIWEAYDAVTELWRITGQFVSEHCGFDYPDETELKMKEFIACLRRQKTIGEASGREC